MVSHLLSYSGVDLSATELPGLDNNNPILIKFSDVKSVPYGSVPKCVYFDPDGSVHFDSVLDGNVCKTVKLGHFSIVVESSTKESSVIHLQSWKKKKNKKKNYKNKNKKKTKKMNKNLEAGIIAALCFIGLCIVLILVWLLVVKLRK
ncbi:cell adhesion molecule-related/down-regulated by oncogenes [Trifolium repens]|nr:cell adhesion molecule-related/down-regulated by oncogenes [Trifolium repens]